MADTNPVFMSRTELLKEAAGIEDEENRKTEKDEKAFENHGQAGEYAAGPEPGYEKTGAGGTEHKINPKVIAYLIWIVYNRAVS